MAYRTLGDLAPALVDITDLSGTNAYLFPFLTSGPYCRLFLLPRSLLATTPCNSTHLANFSFNT